LNLSLNARRVNSKLNGNIFLSLIIFNLKSLYNESLNHLTIVLNRKHGVDISKQWLEVPIMVLPDYAYFSVSPSTTRLIPRLGSIEFIIG